MKLQLKFKQIMVLIKKVKFRNCAQFTNCIGRINNTQVYDALNIDVVIPMYNLIEYSYNYSRTSEILWQYCRDEPASGHDGTIADFTEANAITDSFKIIETITGQIDDNGILNVDIMVPLKNLSNFWRTLEMPLINFEINLDLNWSKNCIIVVTDVANQVIPFSITDTKCYVPVVTLSTEDNAKPLEQLNLALKEQLTRINIDQKNQ